MNKNFEKFVVHVTIHENFLYIDEGRNCDIL